MDFSEITPCGGVCSECEHFKRNECEGCLKNGGQCVSMWENGCYYFKCAKEHNVPFCGLCNAFPCSFLTENALKWKPDMIEHQKNLANKFKLERTKL